MRQQRTMISIHMETHTRLEALAATLPARGSLPASMNTAIATLLDHWQETHPQTPTWSEPRAPGVREMHTAEEQFPCLFCHAKAGEYCKVRGTTAIALMVHKNRQTRWLSQPALRRPLQQPPRGVNRAPYQPHIKRQRAPMMRSGHDAHVESLFSIADESMAL